SGNAASRRARSGANSSTTSALETSARALPAPTVFSNVEDAPITASLRLPLTWRRSATGLSDIRAAPIQLFGDRTGWDVPRNFFFPRPRAGPVMTQPSG